MDTDTDGSCRPDGFSTVRRLEFDMAWPPNRVAAYLLEGPEPVLIDAGPPESAAEARLEDELERVGYALSDIEHVLLTHTHTDHVGQLPALREGGATIHAPKLAIERLGTDPETLRLRVRETAISAGYRGDDLRDVVAAQLGPFRHDREHLAPERARPIDPEEPFSVGDRTVTPLRTPGHQIHHLSFELDLEGTTVLFSGDALIEPFRARAFHVGIDHGAYDAIEAYYDAMDRLAETAASRVYPGHGPVFNDPHRAVRLTRERLDDLLEETRTTLASIEPATPLEVARTRVDEIRNRAPVVDTLGALGALESRGAVTYDVDDGARYYRMS